MGKYDRACVNRKNIKNAQTKKNKSRNLPNKKLTRERYRRKQPRVCLYNETNPSRTALANESGRGANYHELESWQFSHDSNTR